MSKSLTINAPNIVQTRNTMTAVPSGSTSEEDYSVKYVPQELTEAQQAQARQNIGAAAEGEGGATVNEFHYLRDTETDPVSYYVDCPGYEPQEGDLITIVWDWPFDTDESSASDFKNPATLKNNTTNPSIHIKNAHQMATDYDDINPEVNTRWTVRLELVDNAWYAYNISTAVQPDWNTVDASMPSYIKNKPAMAEDSIPEDIWHTITLISSVDTTLTRHGNITKLYQNGIRYTGDLTADSVPVVKGTNVFVYSGSSYNSTWELTNKERDTVYTIILNATFNDFLQGTYPGIVNVFVKNMNRDFGNNYGRAQGNVKYFALDNRAWGGWLQRGTTVFADAPMRDRYNNNLLKPYYTSGQAMNGTVYVPKSRQTEFETVMASEITDPTDYENAMARVTYYDFYTVDPGYNVTIVTLPTT